MAVEVSDEALWPRDPELVVTSAGLFFAVRTHWQDTQSLPPSSNPVFPADGEPNVRLSLVPETEEDGDGPQASPVGGVADDRLSSATVELTEACAPDRDCELRYRLIVQWLDPVPGVTVSARWIASGLIQIEGPEELPVDAQMTIAQTGDVEQRAVPVLADQVAARGIVLDADHPVAAWRVTVEATREALPAPVGFPLEGSGALVTTIRTEPHQERPDSPAVRVSLIPDDSSGGPGLELLPESLRAQHEFEPFRACERDTACRVNFTVLVEWTPENADVTATVDWSLHAALTFHEPPEPSPGAAVSLSIDEALMVRGATPSLMADAAGELELDTSARNVATEHLIVFRANRDALSSDILPAGRAAGVALLTLEAIGNVPSDLPKPIRLVVSVSTATGADTVYPFVAVGGEPATVVLEPLRDCPADRACRVELTLRARIADEGVEAVRETDVRLVWRVETRIPLIRVDAAPPAASLEIAGEPVR